MGVKLCLDVDLRAVGRLLMIDLPVFAGISRFLVVLEVIAQVSEVTIDVRFLKGCLLLIFIFRLLRIYVIIMIIPSGTHDHQVLLVWRCNLRQE